MRHRFSYKLCDCEWVGRGGLRRRVAPVPPRPPYTPFFTPATTFSHPFCEHVLQHSCCSTFLWQRLFFLTSTQKLPSAQDSSFAFHRPGRRDTGPCSKEGTGGVTCEQTHAHTHTRAHRHTHAHRWWQGRAVRLVRRGFRRQEEEYFWGGSNHRWCSSKWKVIVVQWSDMIQVRRKRRKQIWEKKQREREKNKRHTIRNVKIFFFLNTQFGVILHNKKVGPSVCSPSSKEILHVPIAKRQWF